MRSRRRDTFLSPSHLRRDPSGATSLPKASPESLKGGSAAENAQIVRAVLDGKKGAPRDVVLLNAGAALFIGGVADSVRDGVERAARAIDRGDAGRVLDRLVAASTSAETGARA